MRLPLGKLVLPLVLLGINMVISAGFLLSGKLPDPAPAGFWFDGSVVSHAAPWLVAFRLPGLYAVLLACTAFALLRDPSLAASARRRSGAWGPITNLVLALGCFVNFRFLSAVSDPTGLFQLQAADLITGGLMLIGMGNFIAKSASNGFWSLNNRWTRLSETVERQTNRLYGWLWMVGGVVLALFSPILVSLQRPLLDGLLLLAAGLPFVLGTLASYRYAKQSAPGLAGE